MSSGVPAIPSPTIPGDIQPQKQGDIARWARLLAGLFDRSPLEANITFGAEAANIRRVTVRAVDRLNRAVIRPCVVHVWLSDNVNGTPGGTQVVTFVAGTVLHTYTPNVRWEVLSDSTGLIQFDVEVTGAGSRGVYATVMPAPQSATGSWA